MYFDQAFLFINYSQILSTLLPTKLYYLSVCLSVCLSSYLYVYHFSINHLSIYLSMLPHQGISFITLPIHPVPNLLNPIQKSDQNLLLTLKMAFSNLFPVLGCLARS